MKKRWFKEQTSAIAKAKSKNLYVVKAIDYDYFGKNSIYNYHSVGYIALKKNEAEAVINRSFIDDLFDETIGLFGQTGCIAQIVWPTERTGKIQDRRIFPEFCEQIK